MIEAILKLNVYCCSLRIAQKKHQIHQTRVRGNLSRVRDFVIDDPLAVIGEAIKNKHMASFGFGAANMPPIKNQPSMDTVLSHSGRKNYSVIHPFSILSLALNMRIAIH